ncbi:DUF6924 domain-containing protein [Streptomyces sp. A1-5]|uniref:DUF6924 domain-containing protein n=1 Tax=Streptomyces sp. A1-5 TaxID=2738410 RepID=UPI003FA7BBDA
MPYHHLPYHHLYLADAETFASVGLTLLGIDVHGDEDAEPRPCEEPFRIPARHVAGVEVNGNIANLFFREYPDLSDSVRQKLKLISAADVERAVASKKLTNVS